MLETWLPHDDARLKLAPASEIGVVRDLVIRRRSDYALGERAAPFDPRLLALAPGEAELLNDERVGRILARLFDADRGSLLARLVLGAIEIFDIDVSQLHDDSTSISFAGSHAAADGHVRDGSPSPRSPTST